MLSLVSEKMLEKRRNWIDFVFGFFFLLIVPSSKRRVRVFGCFVILHFVTPHFCISWGIFWFGDCFRSVDSLYAFFFFFFLLKFLPVSKEFLAFYVSGSFHILRSFQIPFNFFSCCKNDIFQVSEDIYFSFDSFFVPSVWFLRYWGKRKQRKKRTWNF